MNRLIYKIRLIIPVLLLSGILWAQPVAFPGAEGFGKWATGGRGGEVVAVTNLLDDPANPPEGSFRWALDQAYETVEHPALPGVFIDVPLPLTIIFRVSGIIELQDELTIQRSNLTIAGQTAPGDGICFKGHYVSISGGGTAGIQKNIILRYLRFRPGIDIDPDDLAGGIAGLGVENCENIIVDHCSFSWANEECAIFYDNKYVTVQWCIASEGLYDAGHAKGVRSYCGVWGGQYSSFHHNLIAHNKSRTIRFNGARAHDKEALVDYRNNVIYNWNSIGACYGGEVDLTGGFSHANMVGNYYKPGPATPSTLRFVSPSYNSEKAKGVGKWFLEGNFMSGDENKTNDNWLGVSLGEVPTALRDDARSDIRFRVDEPVPTQTAEEAYNAVLEKAGAAFPRDVIDARIVNETFTGTATGTGVIGNGIIDDPAVVGGYPEYNTHDVPGDQDEDGMDDAWERLNGLNPEDREERNILNGEGYTMLEVYLNSLVGDLTLILPPVVHIKGIDLSYCAGDVADMLLGSPEGGMFQPADWITILGGDTAMFDPAVAGDYEVKYIYDDGAGRKDSIIETITVHALPEATISGLEDSYYQDQAFITVTGNPQNGAFLECDGIVNPGNDESLFDISEQGEYTILYRYVDGFGCVDTAEATTVINPPVALEVSEAGRGIEIFPNPVGNAIRIKSDYKITRVCFYDSSGLKVREIKKSDIDVIDTGHMKGGVYYLHIYRGDELAVKRMVKI
ncbi:MAG: T9SS type A sorting domain-containing protein [Bacteroidales bacterium]|nr:T9SS type A sorting domain-containing protein [Bacteroidales bacterium]